MEGFLAITLLFAPIMAATYFYGGKGTLIAGVIGLALIATLVGFLFFGLLLGFLDGGIGYEIIIAVYAGMVIVAGMPVSYLVVWALKQLPRQRD